MPAPEALVQLALTLHADEPDSVQDHTATIAARLGYTEVWLPVGADAGWPDPDRFDRLSQVVGGARLGLIVRCDPTDAVGDLLRLTVSDGSEPLLELPARSAALVRAVGGDEAWRARVRLPNFDAVAAGTVVATPALADTVARVATVAARRQEASLAADQHPIVAAVPVSIGRTYSEAAARAVRDPRFHGSAHPRESGLFGTYEQAQTQALELAAAGVDILRLTVAHEIDVADLLAQIRSLVVGATPVLHARRG